MTRITADWLDAAATQKLFHMFSEAGHELFCVGGCVRNALMDVPVADIDMSTNAHPEAVLKLAKTKGLHAIPTGIDHGTVTIVVEKEPYEITTYRRDVETHGRRAVVAFSDNIEDDAQRRDFTMNALYCDADGKVHDLVGGVADLQSRAVRFIGDPSGRITEDYLRILRFFRFHAWYGDPEGGIDADGLAACAEHGDGIQQLSRERIGAEMIKILSAPDPAPAVASMAQAGILHRVMPGADTAMLPVLVHIEGTRAADWQRRVLALGGENINETWRLSKTDRRALEAARHSLKTQTPLEEVAYRHGSEMALNLALMQAAATQAPFNTDLEDTLIQAAKARFPVRAKDLMPELKGAALGKRLDTLEAAWIASGFTLTKKDLLAR